MAKPAPCVGLVICYDYLWKSENLKGRQDGSKDRPTAVVVAPAGKNPNTAMVFAITHTEPDDPRDGIKLQLTDCVWMGLDNKPQWIVTNECNLVEWDDAGIIPIPETGNWIYGTMTQQLSKEVQASALGHLSRNQLTIIDRLSS